MADQYASNERRPVAHRRQPSAASTNDVPGTLAYYAQDDTALGGEDLLPPNLGECCLYLIACI